ncbi:MAG: hypothetical protein GY861_05300 [bacterium]|nr:hypothetical protein [bacterium]
MAKKIDRLEKFSTSGTKPKDMGQVVEEMISMVDFQRRGWEKRWYDNNFFDDGFHFRFLSRSTGRIVDLSKKTSVYTPMRVIPKASRQIRGIVNLITQPDFVPVIYPDRIVKSNYGQGQEQRYEQDLKVAKDRAKKVGYWILDQWDEQEIHDWKAPFMGLLTAKQGISYLQIWPDARRELIKTQVYDAFDIYLDGTVTEMKDSPFVIKAFPKLISEIKANPNFDEDQVRKITPDNRHASSEIKESYLSSKFGKETKQDSAATLIQKEAYIKERLNGKNIDIIRKQKDGEKILKGKEEGDIVIRQVFAGGNIWLRDVYTDLSDYPFVDLRFEPGQLYQIPLIDRFKSSNKSLDSVISRLERYTHTMTSGKWLVRRGENIKPSNLAGGEVLYYDAVKPEQMQMASIPGHFFNFITLLNSFMEEYGITVSSLGKIPKGVRAHAAIESLKAGEHSSQSIAVKQMKKLMKSVAYKMLEVADAYFMKPKEVAYETRNEPIHFDVMGQRGIDGRRELEIEVPEGIIPLKKDYKIRIDVQVGAGFTIEGKRQAMLKLGEYMRDLAREGYLTQEAVKVVLQRMLETYEFGATAEFMEAMEEGGGQMTEEQISQMKVALAEVKKDLMQFESQQRKVDFAEVLKDVSSASGGDQGAQGGSREVQTTKTVETGKDGKKTKQEVKIIQKEE